MNFLAHYYLLPDKENSDKVLGNLLPDLMRGFSKIYRKEIKDNPAIQGSDLLEGIDYHLKTDAIFHEHDFFLKHCEKIKQSIENQNVAQHRNFIVAHVMVELLIDQFLIKEDPALANQFYASLEKTMNNNLKEKLNITLNRQNSSKISIIFKGFIESKYAYTLQKNEGVVEALNHIIGKRIGSNFSSSLWVTIVQEARGQMNDGLPSFLQNLKEALKDA